MVPKLSVANLRWLGVVGFGLGAALIAAVCTGTVLGIGYSIVESLPYFHESDLDVRGGLWFVAINAAYVSFFIALPTILLVGIPPSLPPSAVRQRPLAGNGRCHGHNASSAYSPLISRPASNAAVAYASSPALRRQRLLNGFWIISAIRRSPSIRRTRAGRRRRVIV